MSSFGSGGFDDMMCPTCYRRRERLAVYVSVVIKLLKFDEQHRDGLAKYRD
jgi:hypothetical protein